MVISIDAKEAFNDLQPMTRIKTKTRRGCPSLDERYPQKLPNGDVF